jgi:benzoyl-CoA reductase/2-hydroxyglutaryl-CoA dehydratase subunit BcrC/BadD/HgdB
MVRECALETPAFAQLWRIWRGLDDRAAAFRAAGGRVVGCLGCDVPEEYLLAGGLLPLRIAPDPESGLAAADEVLEACFDPMARSQFDRIVRREEHKPWDYIAVSNSTDVLVRLYLYLRELRRTEKDAPVPDTAFIDWLFTRSRKFQLYNEAQAGLFRKKAEEWAGKPITDGDVREAVHVLNGQRAALRRISALRLGEKPRVTGTEALVITGAGFYMDRAEHRNLVNDVADAAAAWPPLTGPRLYFSGTEQYGSEVYEALEADGAVIVAEDQDCGMRWYEGDTDPELPPEKAVARRYMLRSPSPKKATVAERTEALCRAAGEAKVQGAAVCMNQFEEAASWDFPEEKRALEALGIRAAEFCKLPYPPARDPALKARLRDFAGSLRGGTADG